MRVAWRLCTTFPVFFVFLAWSQLVSTLPLSWILHSCLPWYPMARYSQVGDGEGLWNCCNLALDLLCLLYGLPICKGFLHSTCKLSSFGCSIWILDSQSFWLLWRPDLQSLPRPALRQVLCSANHFDVLHLLTFLKRSTQRHKLAGKDTFPIFNVKLSDTNTVVDRHASSHVFFVFWTTTPLLRSLHAKLQVRRLESSAFDCCCLISIYMKQLCTQRVVILAKHFRNN